MKRKILCVLLVLLPVLLALGATNFPTSLDSYTTKTSIHDVQASHINDPQDAIEALQAKVGIDSSSVTTSHDYMLSHGLLEDGSATAVYTGTVPAVGGSQDVDCSSVVGTNKALVLLRFTCGSNADLAWQTKGASYWLEGRAGSGRNSAYSVSANKYAHAWVITDTSGRVTFKEVYDGDGATISVYVDAYIKFL